MSQKTRQQFLKELRGIQSDSQDKSFDKFLEGCTSHPIKQFIEENKAQQIRFFFFIPYKVQNNMQTRRDVFGKVLYLNPFEIIIQRFEMTQLMFTEVKELLRWLTKNNNTKMITSLMMWLNIRIKTNNSTLVLNIFI